MITYTGNNMRGPSPNPNPVPTQWQGLTTSGAVAHHEVPIQAAPIIMPDPIVQPSPFVVGRTAGRLQRKGAFPFHRLHPEYSEFQY